MADELSERRLRHEGEAPSRRRAKKDRRRWCGGREGREHDPIIVLHNRAKDFRPVYYARWDTWQRETCWYPPWSSGRWRCRHQLTCRWCLKILRDDLGPDCPHHPSQKKGTP